MNEAVTEESGWSAQLETQKNGTPDDCLISLHTILYRDTGYLYMYQEFNNITNNNISATVVHCTSRMITIVQSYCPQSTMYHRVDS